MLRLSKAVSVFVERPTDQTNVTVKQRFPRWMQAQGRSLDTAGGFKNTSGPVGIPLKRGATGARQ